MDFEWSAEQLELRRATRTLAVREFATKAFLPGRPPNFVRERARRLAELGLTGITFPVADGGQGGSLLDAVIVLHEVARVCPHTGDVVQAFNFGAIRQLQALGSDRLKDEWLRPALQGDVLLSLAMSEPDAGSALGAMRTRARRVGDTVVLNGSKIFATHGVDADLVVVWCRFGDGPRDVGAVAVPVGSEGFARGPEQSFMSGERYCEMVLDRCTVPAHHVLADHDAFRSLLPIFNVERLGNATRSLALATRAFEFALDYARDRKVGTESLSDLQGIQWKFADMKLHLDPAYLLLYRAACRAGGPSDQDTAIAKCFANEAAFFVANEALQLHGATGYSVGNPVEYLFRRIRGWMIAGGSTEVLRNRIARSILNDAARAG